MPDYLITVTETAKFQTEVLGATDETDARMQALARWTDGDLTAFADTAAVTEVAVIAPVRDGRPTSITTSVAGSHARTFS